MTTSLNTEARIAGAFYGQALGDAFGMPSELWPRSRVKAHFGWIDRFLDGPAENSAAQYFRAGQFTDDTSMALALADSIIECDGMIDADSVARHIMLWAEKFDAFSKNVLGPTSKVALTAIRSGQGISTIPNLGVTNGAAMRVMPLGCLLSTQSLEKFCADVASASSPTHKSDISVAGAVAVAYAISMAIDGVQWPSIREALPGIARFAQTQTGAGSTFSASLASRIELAFDVTDFESDVIEASEKVYNLIGAGTSTIESVPAAFAMVELAKLNPNVCAELCANLGGDTDTIGAMATAICGAYSGFESIDLKFVRLLDEANQVDFSAYIKKFTGFRRTREANVAMV
jgi:ADP-ribosylglycohydrolase